MDPPKRQKRRNISNRAFSLDDHEDSTKIAVSILLRIRNNISKMLKIRGYQNEEKNQDNLISKMTPDKFEKFLIQRSDTIDTFALGSINTFYIRKDANGNLIDRVWIYFPPQEFNAERKVMKPGVTFIKALISSMKVNNVNHVIFITKDKMTPSATKTLANKFNQYRIEQFLYNDLVYDATDHFLVGQNFLMNEEQKHNFLTESGYLMKQLPIITVFDIQARWMGARENEITRTNRKTQELTIGGEVYYRRVVNIPLIRDKRKV